MRSRPLQERFNEKFVRDDSTGCWLWLGAITSAGYGSIGTGEHGRSMQANRASWLIHRGPIPEGMSLCHRCDVRRCVNPDHLFLGTSRDNALDREAKGRGRWSKKAA